MEICLYKGIVHGKKYNQKIEFSDELITADLESLIYYSSEHKIIRKLFLETKIYEPISENVINAYYKHVGYISAILRFKKFLEYLRTFITTNKEYIKITTILSSQTNTINILNVLNLDYRELTITVNDDKQAIHNAFINIPIIVLEKQMMNHFSWTYSKLETKDLMYMLLYQEPINLLPNGIIYSFKDKIHSFLLPTVVYNSVVPRTILVN